MPTSTDKLKTMSLSEIMTEYPQAEPVLTKYGLAAYAKTETAKHENLQASVLVHSIDLDTLMNELVRVISG